MSTRKELIEQIELLEHKLKLEKRFGNVAAILLIVFLLFGIVN